MEISDDYARVRDCRLVLLATPTEALVEVARSLGDHLDGRHYVVHGVRGLVGDTLRTVTDVLREETPARRLGALGGPALAEDLDADLPSVLVAGSRFPEVTTALNDVFSSLTLRVYTTDDLRGLEWASALVGCLAVAIGFAKGMGLSPGLVAAIVCRSMAEAARIAEAAGGNQTTLLGLAGYGDLLASVEMQTRPEVVFGRALAAGKSPEEARAMAGARLEAIELIPRVVAFAQQHGVRARIFPALARGLRHTDAAGKIIEELMTVPV